MLSTYHLLNITSTHYCTQHTLEGVYSIDHIPRHINRFPSFWISNSEPSTHPGRHWISCFFPDESKPAEFFCSLGKDPKSYHLQLPNILRNNGNGEYIWNSMQVQSDTSQACAYFVLYFVDLRSRGIHYSDFIETFSKHNLNGNENKVISYVKYHMHPNFITC